MKVLITGKNGQVGSELLKQSINFDLIGLCRKDLDLSKPSTIKKILDNYKPDIIINAAAYTAVDKAESDKEIAFAVNQDSVFEMAQYARKNNCILYHFSTDYVFDGQLNTPYVETDKTNPLNIYGESKLRGEQAIIETGCDYCIFRTSWVYANTGNNFIKTILKLLPLKDELNIVNDQMGAPTSARLIAETTLQALNKNIPSGIYHLTSSGATSWYELARYAGDFFYDSHMREKIKPISSSEYSFIAKRPKNSRLNTNLLENVLNKKFPTWQEEFNIVFN